jgi:hypothetical protein
MDSYAVVEVSLGSASLDRYSKALQHFATVPANQMHTNNPLLLAHNN